MCHKESSITIHFKTMPAYQGDDFITDMVDGTHLYEKYKVCLLVAVFQDDNNNIMHIAFAIVEGENFDAWQFFVTVARSNRAWSPPRAFHIFLKLLEQVQGTVPAELIINTRYSRMVCKYEMHYWHLREWSKAYTNWLDRILSEQYTLVFDGGY
ncbi:hypothetical protein Ahy_A02g007226 [Arachis hypogaea]|uniref:MULE transposase domain-containing protein n=1 Tax=Arachis hypogaea TaxID=3818 RepID=A0A445ECE3_ARAHY|nr:hypothetical protein Ahy_A02g007226 [Arachis hypogaea]